MYQHVHEIQPGVNDRELPADVQAAIEWLFERCRDGVINVRATAIGDQRILDAFANYGRIERVDDTLLALSATPSLVASEVARLRPSTVYTLVSGPLHAILSPIREGIETLAADLPVSRWSELGYERVGRNGFLGPGALSLMLAERLFRIARRPDVADRFRIAGQRSVSSLSGTAAVVVNVYRKAGR